MYKNKLYGISAFISIGKTPNIQKGKTLLYFTGEKYT